MKQDSVIPSRMECTQCGQPFFLSNSTIVDTLCDDCRSNQVYLTDKLTNLIDTHKDQMREKTQCIKELLNYLHGSVFDKATGYEWEKTYRFIDLISKAEAELAELRGSLC